MNQERRWSSSHNSQWWNQCLLCRIHAPNQGFLELHRDGDANFYTERFPESRNSDASSWRVIPRVNPPYCSSQHEYGLSTVPFWPAQMWPMILLKKHSACCDGFHVDLPSPRVGEVLVGNCHLKVFEPRQSSTVEVPFRSCFRSQLVAKH